MIEGWRVNDLTVHLDERGSFTELLRKDWQEFLGDDQIVQFNLSFSYPGVVRAWHRHLKGQNDYFLVMEGSIKVCAYDERQDSPTYGELDEVILGPGRMRVVRVPGECWHGYKAISSDPVKVEAYLWIARSP